MIETLVQHGIQYGVYLAEVGLFLYLVLWGHCKRLAGVSLYVAGLLTIDAIARPRVLALYGFTSPQYFYFFYVTDAILALSAFLLVCSRSEEHTSELQSHHDLVCRLLLEKKNRRRIRRGLHVAEQDAHISALLVGS